MAIDKEKAIELEENNREIYNKIANQFSGTRMHLWDDLKPLEEYSKEGDRVLDLACGNGRLSQLFEGKNIKYIGVDYSEKLIELALKEYKSKTTDFFVKKMGEISFDDEYFDVVYCIAAFQHLASVEHRQSTLKQIHSALKTGGTFIMLNWNLYSDWANDKYDKFQFETGEFMIPWRDGDRELLGERYYHGFTPEEMKDLLEKNGFTSITQSYTKKGILSNKEEGENLLTIAKKA